MEVLCLKFLQGTTAENLYKPSVSILKRNIIFCKNKLNVLIMNISAAVKYLCNIMLEHVENTCSWRSTSLTLFSSLLWLEENGTSPCVSQPVVDPEFRKRLRQHQMLGHQLINYRPQTKLRKGNVFTSVCQEFCPQGEGGVHQPR